MFLSLCTFKVKSLIRVCKTRYYITNMINKNHKYYMLLPEDIFCTRSTPHFRNSFKPYVKRSRSFQACNVSKLRSSFRVVRYHYRFFR